MEKNREMLYFQKDNEKYLDSYNSYINDKKSEIEGIAVRYLNYMKNHPSPPKSIESKINKENINNNFNTIDNNRGLGKRSCSEMDIFNRGNNNTIEENKRFIPRYIKVRSCDITNPFFYDQIAKEVFNRNKDTLNYNLAVSEKKFEEKKYMMKFDDKKLAIAPGKIRNSKYYDLGKSSLISNPIINNEVYINYSRKKLFDNKRYNNELIS